AARGAEVRGRGAERCLRAGARAVDAQDRVARARDRLRRGLVGGVVGELAAALLDGVEERLLGGEHRPAAERRVDRLVLVERGAERLRVLGLREADGVGLAVHFQDRDVDLRAYGGL